MSVIPVAHAAVQTSHTNRMLLCERYAHACGLVAPRTLLLLLLRIQRSLHGNVQVRTSEEGCWKRKTVEKNKKISHF